MALLALGAELGDCRTSGKRIYLHAFSNRALAAKEQIESACASQRFRRVDLLLKVTKSAIMK